jgi:uncharacterized protein YbjT (DUF2867 family)
MSRLVIFGGNGYVGQRIVRSALAFGYDVISISRSGAPSNTSAERSFFREHLKDDHGVQWVSGDVFKPESYQEFLKGATGVVSCIGAFGSDSFMQKVNGDANCLAVSESLRAGVPQFVFVSTVENTLPKFVLRGYFEGKRRAEEAVMDAYPHSGTILRPSFVYGCRDVGSTSVPLGLLGKPMQVVLSMPGVKELQNLPGMKALLTPPVSVDDVGLVAAAAAVPKDTLGEDLNGIISADSITAWADKLRTSLATEFVKDQRAQGQSEK